MKETIESGKSVAREIMPLLERMEATVETGSVREFDVQLDDAVFRFTYDTLEDELTINCKLKSKMTEKELKNLNPELA